jgi:hypothetical protein
MFRVSQFFGWYIAIWVSFCVVAAAIVSLDRKRFIPESREYWGFLCVPWKLCLFVPAFLFVTFAGRYTNDETWDVGAVSRQLGGTDKWLRKDR